MLEVQNPVLWTEGLFLGQQHLQQWEKGIESRARFLNQGLDPWNWGIKRCEIDYSSLDIGVCLVTKCQVVLQNGEIVSLDSLEDRQLSVDLKGRKKAEVSVYLCVPTNQQAGGVRGYPGVENNEKPKWLAKYLKVDDQYDPKRMCEVLFGQLNAYLSLEASEVSCCIGKARNLDEERFEWVSEVIPPIVHVSSSGYLMEVITQLSASATSKFNELKRFRIRDVTNNVPVGPDSISATLLMPHFSLFIERIRFLLEHPQQHPKVLYGIFRDFFAMLRTFDVREEDVEFPRYAQDDLTFVFAKSREIIRDLMDLVVPEKMSDLEIKRFDDSYYHIDDIETKVLEGADFYFAIQMQEGGSDKLEQVLREVKIASIKDVSLVVASALPGVHLSSVYKPPPQLPIKAGWEYFKLARKGPFWENVVSSRTIGIYLSNNLGDLEIDLLTLPV